MINSMQKAIIRKDMKEITANKNLFLSMLIVPFIFSVVLPLIFVLVIYFVPDGAKDFEVMLKMLPAEQKVGEIEEVLLRLIMNNVIPMFFLLIPIMTASVMAASSFVGEKEKRTLETLLYCPLPVNQIFQAKILASFLISTAVTWASFLLMIVTVQVSLLLLGSGMILFDISWLIMLVLVSPAVSMIAITMIVKISAKSKTVEESQQRAVFLVLPVLLLAAGQFSGLILISKWIVLGLGVVLAVVALLLIRGIVGKYSYETLLK